MLDFTYQSPVKLYFGKGEEQNIGKYVREYGGSRVLLHYGGGSVVRSGLMRLVREKLEAEGMAVFELGGAQPNPRVELCREGIGLCRREGVDFIVALGGGSAMDSAKLIALGVCYDGDPWDIQTGAHRPAAALPVATIPTLAATGSENNGIFVITNGDKKLGQATPLAAPKFSILNPETTFTLPPYQTASGIVDIMMHTLDRYFTPTERPMEITDEISEGLLRTVIRNAAVVMRKPDDYDARAEIMWAGALSHNGLTGCGQATDFAPHMLQHELGGMFDSAHGAGIAAVWGSWARHVYKTNPRRFAKIAVNVLGVQAGADDEQTALAGICAMEDFFRSIGMPTSIAELEGFTLTDEQIDALARACVSRSPGGTIGAFQTLHLADVRAIYTAAR